MKAKLLEKHAAGQLQQENPTQGQTWEYVCDCKEDNCDKCAPRKKIDTFEPAHAARRSIAPTRSNDEPSAPAKAPVLKAAAKRETKETKPPVTTVSPALKPALKLGERKRVPGH